MTANPAFPALADRCRRIFEPMLGELRASGWRALLGGALARLPWARTRRTRREAAAFAVGLQAMVEAFLLIVEQASTGTLPAAAQAARVRRRSSPRRSSPRPSPQRGEGEGHPPPRPSPSGPIAPCAMGARSRGEGEEPLPLLSAAELRMAIIMDDLPLYGLVPWVMPDADAEATASRDRRKRRWPKAPPMWRAHTPGVARRWLAPLARQPPIARAG